VKIRHKELKAPRIEMLPLIDIVFLLLVFFIYAMLSMAVHQGLKLDLPESTTAVKSIKSPFSLFIRKTNSGIALSLNEKPLLLSQLALNLPTQKRNNSEKPSVLIFAEEAISYQQLYLVLDELKKCGISKISLQASSE